MFKSIVCLACLALIPWLASRFDASTQERKFPQPKGTIVVYDSTSEEERHEQKSAWLKGMKKAAPGVDPNRIDHEYRFERQRRLAYRSSVDSLAGGKVRGEFEERGCNFNSGRIMAVEWDTINDVMFVQTAGGIMFSGPEDGSNWQPVNEQFRMADALFVRFVDHNGSQRLLSGTGGSYFYYSDDLGITWDTAVGLDPNAWNRSFRDVVLLNDSAKTLYALTTEWTGGWKQRLHRSTDHGSSFQLMYTFTESGGGAHSRLDLWAHRYEEATYLVYRDSIFELSDSTRSFRGKISGTSGLGTMLLTGTSAPASGNEILYVYSDQDIYRSDDNGVTWTLKGNVGENPFRRTSFECSLSDPDALFFGAVECWRSWNGGANFNKVNNWFDYYDFEANKLHADIPNIQSFYDDHGNEVLFISTDASFYSSTNKGLTVQNRGMAGLNVSRLYDHYTDETDPGIIHVGTQDQGYQRILQNNGGILSFEQEISGDYGWLVSSDDGYSVWMNYPGFAMHVTEAGFANMSTTSWDFGGANSLWIPPLMADPIDGYTAYVAGNLNSGSGSYMIQLVHTGGSIVPSQMPFNFNQGGAGQITAMAYSPIDPNHWYVLTENGRIYHSDDSGTSWTSHTISNAPGTHYFYGMYIYPSPNSLGTVYIGGSGYSNPPIYKLESHGATATALNNGLPPTLVHGLAGDPTDSLLFAATEVGPFVYVAGDDQWYDLALMGMPDVNCWSVEYIDALDVVRFGTHARGLWDLNLETPGIGLEEDQMAEWSVYPNPTKDFIRFSEPLKSGVLVDLQGRVVRQWSYPIDQLDISDLTTGKYVLRSAEGATVVVKL